MPGAHLELEGAAFEDLADGEFQDSVLSGLSCTIPNGQHAPGNVCPIPLVPIMGLTHLERLSLPAAAAPTNVITVMAIVQSCLFMR